MARPTKANAPVIETEALRADKPAKESQQHADTPTDAAILSDGSSERAALRVALDALPARPLSASQIAYLAAVAHRDDFNRRQGRPPKNSPPVRSIGDVSAERGISPSLLEEAVNVDRTLAPDDTRRGRIAAGSIEVGRIYDELRRGMRNDEHRGDIPAVPDGKYGLILADPPWQYDDGGVGRRGAAETHYLTTSLADLIAMRPMLDAVAADDAMLVMWATSPLLPDALTLMEAWGFAYVSSAVWHKTGRIGMGSIFRIDHELLLVGRRGGGIPVADRGVRSVIAAPVGAHSAKPESAYDAIERLWPDVRRIELFARRARDGWRAWGTEAPSDGEAA